MFFNQWMKHELISKQGGVVGHIHLKQMGWHPILNVNSLIYVYVTCVYSIYIYVHIGHVPTVCGTKTFWGYTYKAY